MDIPKYVVTTKRFVNRQKEFQKMNSHLSNYTWSFGLDAQEVNTVEEIRQRREFNVAPEISWTLGSICNAISHLKLIRKCAEGNEIITIMEDDAVVSKNFDQNVTVLIEKLSNSDFDLIQWGWNWNSFVFIREKDGNIRKIDYSGQYLQIDPKEFIETEPRTSLEELVLTWGSHCYTITPSGAQKILNFYPQIDDHFVNSLELTGIVLSATTIDGVFNSFYPRLKSYIAIPPLSYVTNDKEKSVISN
jgi:GR25 family glycosyltransferase involved in LPS biosynthesis